MDALFYLRRALGIFSFLLASQVLVYAAPLVTGADAGGSPQVKVFPAPGSAPTRTFLAYSPDFFGGVRVALGDVDGDGVQDIVTGPGPSGEPLVRVFNGATGALIRNFFAYDPGFVGGIFVAAGDINGDGAADIITGSAADFTTTRVKVFSGTNSAVLADFAPYGPSFTGGVLVASADVNGDGTPDIITGAGLGSAHVKVFNGRTRSEFMSFIAYPPSESSGVFVAAGDVNGDGTADIITGAGPGGEPLVRVFRGRTGQLLSSFFAYERNFTGGVRVGSGDVDNDGRVDLLTAPAAGRAPLVRVFNGRTGAVRSSFFAYDQSFTNGVFVGGVAQLPILVTTNPATDVTVTTATLHGTVDPNDRTVSVRFQYGLTTSYGSTVDAVPAEVSGSDPTAVSADLSGLLPGRTYHFRAVASDGIGGTVFGQDRVFTTTPNKKPSGGSFTVSPPSPVPAGTVLTATFADWTDEDGHTPLTYEVREGNIVIATRSEDPTRDFTLPPGTHVLTGYVYDDLGGFTETEEVEVVVEGDPESEAVATSRTSIPGAGTGGIPEDAVWTSFGVPAMANDAVKYLASFVSPTGRGRAIFSNETPVVFIGQPVPGAGAGGEFDLPTDAVFKVFKDPVTDAAGNLAFIATIRGAGVTRANDTVVVSNGRTGTLEVIAREGTAAPGTDGARYGAFKAVSIGGGGIGGTIFTAGLVGAVRPSNNQGAWWQPAGSASTILLVREGGPGFVEGETIRTFTIHHAWPKTPGHGRGQIDGDEALLQVTLSSGRQAQVVATPGALDAIAATGDTFGEGSVWIRMAQPSSGDSGQFLSVRASYRPASSGPNARPVTGIVNSLDSGITWSVIAEVGDPAPGVDATWVDLGHPVNSLTGSDLAFWGRLGTTSVNSRNDTGIWWRTGTGPVTLLAQEGTQAVGAAVGERFAAFSSLAFPGGNPGPLFVAKLASSRGTVNAGNDKGVWTVDSSGSLRLLFREGQKIGTKRLRSFTVLSVVSGSPGVTRSFNIQGEVTWRATFTDGTTAIMITQIP